MSKVFGRIVAALAMSAALSVGTEAATINIHNGADPASLDPQRLSGDWENRIAGDIFEGLVQNDINAEPIPGQAVSWTISSDKTVYTFTLRNGIKWTDGTPVTAGDFVFAFQRLMDPAKAAKYAYLQYPIKNAEKINKGEIADLNQLGVKAIDDRTLEITLEHPTAYCPGTSWRPKGRIGSRSAISSSMGLTSLSNGFPVHM